LINISNDKIIHKPKCLLKPSCNCSARVSGWFSVSPEDEVDVDDDEEEEEEEEDS
jgi:hypothetical protein